jgi:hypothetical protein
VFKLILLEQIEKQLLFFNLLKSIMRVRKGGYTEAEQLALEWSKKQKKEEDPVNVKHRFIASFLHKEMASATRPPSAKDDDEGKKERKTSKYGDEGKKERKSSRKEHRHEHKHERRHRSSSPKRRQRSSSPKVRRRSPSPKKVRKDGERESPRYSPYRGAEETYLIPDDKDNSDLRVGSSSSVRKNSQNDDNEWERSRSRDRRGRDGGRKEEKGERKDDDINDRDSRIKRRYSRSRSRSNSEFKSRANRSRSRSRSPIPAHWAHDKYSLNVVDSPTYDEKLEKRRELNNYRPPSPTWVSRAGGVAIMRKKISD